MANQEFLSQLKQEVGGEGDFQSKICNMIEKKVNNELSSNIRRLKSEIMEKAKNGDFSYNNGNKEICGSYIVRFPRFSDDEIIQIKNAGLTSFLEEKGGVSEHNEYRESDKRVLKCSLKNSSSLFAYFFANSTNWEAKCSIHNGVFNYVSSLNDRMQDENIKCLSVYLDFFMGDMDYHRMRLQVPPKIEISIYSLQREFSWKIKAENHSIFGGDFTVSQTEYLNNHKESTVSCHIVINYSVSF